MINSSLANEAAKPAETTQDVDKAQQQRNKEWMDLTSQISGLKTKIKSKEESIKEIIKHKHHAKSKAEAEHAVNNLKEEHKELMKLEEEYNQNIQLMKYRYPDVGLTEKRKYERVKVKSLEDYEEQMTLEGKIKQSVQKIQEHYGLKDDHDDAPKVREEEENKREEEINNLAKPIIIRK
ncbi:MAG: hypothetical protein HUU56_13710 [Bdellovibrionaceae bacterium]|nr:hypothetical protein [Pseudobdellovibrionaceae bacterium]